MSDYPPEEVKPPATVTRRGPTISEGATIDALRLARRAIRTARTHLGHCYPFVGPAQIGLLMLVLDEADQFGAEGTRYLDRSQEEVRKAEKESRP